MGTHTALHRRLGGQFSARGRTQPSAGRRRPSRLTLVLPLLAVGLAAPAAAAAGPRTAPYPPGAPCAVQAATEYSDSLRVDLALSGSGFAPGEDVAVWLGHPDFRAATVAARTDGSLRAVVAVSRRVATSVELITASSSTASCSVPTPAIPQPSGAQPSAPRPGGSRDRPSAGPGAGPPDSGTSTSSPRPGGSDTATAGSSPAVPTPSSGPPRTVPPRAGDFRDATGLTSLSPWLIGGIAAGLLIFGLLATRLLTRRSG